MSPESLRAAVEELYARYVHTLDNEDFAAWLDLFVDDCAYKVQARENHARNLPLAVMAYESRGMLQDRVYGIRETLYHQPYYQRHAVTNFLIQEDGQSVHVQANYSVVRTKRNSLPDLFSVGRYLDTLVRQGDALKIKEKLCIYDSELIANSLIYPI